MGDLDFSVVVRALPYLFLTGMKTTIALTILAGSLGLLLGTLLAIMRLSSVRVIAAAATVYVNCMRSVPLLLVIFWFYFLVPYLAGWLAGSPRPIQVGAFVSAVVSFTLFEAAYFCEIIRAGIQSIPRGQFAASMAIGLTSRQAMLHVILPQAMRNMLPPLLTLLVVLFQDTSLVYVLSLTDFLVAASTVGHRDGRLTEMYLFVAVVYFVICFTASRLAKRLENKQSGAR